jgi:hypothetical protein
MARITGGNADLVFSITLIAIVSTLIGSNAEAVKGDERPHGRVIYNLDCTEYFVGTFGPIVPATIDKFVDNHAAAGVTDLFINVNAKRTNYRSDAWEAHWDGLDPKGGDDQPFFAGLDPQRRFETGLFWNMYSLHEQGCDYPERMIDSARRNKLKAWISLRMNDDHNPHLPDHPAHSTLWRSHPEWRLAYGLDYEQKEVREYHMKLVQEVCSRYDIDGLELDFVRFWLYFRDGRQHDGVPLITAFVEQARQIVRAAEQRLGHPVQLAVRVPSTPWIARRHGLDAISWAKAGLVDLIIASPFWPSVDSDVPIEAWKGLLIGTDVPVAVGLESGMHSGDANRTITPEEIRGVIVNGLHRGADDVYFFNLFTGPYQSWPREAHDQVIQDASSLAELCAAPRRHPISITSPWSEGEPGKASVLPHSGSSGAFRVYSGPKPAQDQQAKIELVAEGHDQPLAIRLNGIQCDFAGLVKPEHITASGWEAPVPQRHTYDVPALAISDGYNLVEVNAEQDVTITWLEISVQ